jgi:hypothetical protein
MITLRRSSSWVLAEVESTPTPFFPLCRSTRPDNHHRSCLLHRFVKDEWRVLSSQTIGVEFASKIIRVGTGARRKRIKLQVHMLPIKLQSHANILSSGTQQAQNASARSPDPTTVALLAQSWSTTSPLTAPSPLFPPS